jgi:GWxTD domain-containing protein
LIMTASAQYMSSSKLSGIGLPFFQAGLFRTFDAESVDSLGQVRLYFQIINDDLTFVIKNDIYSAEVKFDIYLTSKENNYVFNRTISKEITTASFEETNSRQLTNTYETTIPVKPGNYELVLTALDKNNNKQVNRKINFQVLDIKEKDFLLSDIIFFEKYEMDSTLRVKSFEPNLTNNFSSRDQYFYFYFASLQKDPTDTLLIEYTIRNPEGLLSQYNQYTVSNNSHFNEHFIRINRHQFNQSRYELEVTGTYKNKAIKARKRFTFFWTETPESPQDLDQALRQLGYIPEADSIGWALKQNYEDRLAYFKRFWKRMDPNPETEKNELMEEYYLRVNMANQNFSTLNQDGWQTDKGRIFIKFGEPDDIERHPFEIDSKPYEIWRYYTLRKTFVFLDRSGFGDYYLHPNYLDEEYN